jgi:hypothetical protein
MGWPRVSAVTMEPEARGSIARHPVKTVPPQGQVVRCNYDYHRSDSI